MAESTTFFAPLEWRPDAVQVREVRTLEEVSRDPSQGCPLRLIRDQLDGLRERFPAPLVVLRGQLRLRLGSDQRGKRDDRLDRSPPPRVQVEYGVHRIQLRGLEPGLLAQLAQGGKVRGLAGFDPAGDSLPERSAVTPGPMQQQELGRALELAIRPHVNARHTVRGPALAACLVLGHAADCRRRDRIIGP